MNNLLSSISVIGLLVLLGVSFYLGGKFQEPEIITKTKTVTIIDTTTVDSLKTIIEKFEEVPVIERDTVYLDRPEVDDIFTESSRQITTTYSDSMLTASNYIELDLESNDIKDHRFSYLLKRRLVRQIDRTQIKHITRTTTTTETRTIQEGGYFQAGAIASFDSFAPVIAYTTRNKSTLMYGYDFMNDMHKAGFMIKF